MWESAKKAHADAKEVSNKAVKAVARGVEKRAGLVKQWDATILKGTNAHVQATKKLALAKKHVIDTHKIMK
jgi:hypothetical protein